MKFDLKKHQFNVDFNDIFHCDFLFELITFQNIILFKLKLNPSFTNS